MQHLLYGELVPWYYLLDPTEDHIDEAATYQAAFERAIGSEAETLLELGAGGGNNAFFLKRRFRCTLTDISAPMLELSRALNPDCEHTIGDMRALRLERTFDAVVATLVLCSVDDPAEALREVLRVLKPGGRFVFMEHVAAPRGTFTRWLQRLLSPLWNFAADGCHLDRDTAAVISTAGFRTVVHDHFDLPIPVVGPHLAGTAWAP